ncbi:MAG: 2-dehydropantoate 2-reductase [Rhodospirillaceae bacterium]|nr:2-dehydropantoate 2-reductase [Rhodospirillaceae bacterium]MBL6941875.1 2-dehydropantoate 2-reductase [Rhodospirillales bacterium]
MKICVFGAGAIGGYMAVELKRAGYDVSIVTRGAHLEAIRANGLRLRIAGEEKTATVTASDDPADLGSQDYVILTLKAHSVPPIADKLAPLLGKETAVVTGMNGMPFWYFHGLEGAWRDHRIESVDPGGVLWRTITPQRAIGCVVYPACEVTEPGIIEHIEGNRFSLGEPDGSKSERVQALSKAMIAAGLRAPVKTNIRDEIWLKLWGNLSFNPISALTGSTLEDIVSDPDSCGLARSMMVEAEMIAAKLGVKFPIDVDKRIKGAGAVGAHKTSMLQDLERRRPMEIDALVSSVQELGLLTDTPTPTIDTVLAMTKRLARQAGCYD